MVSVHYGALLRCKSTAVISDMHILLNFFGKLTIGSQNSHRPHQAEVPAWMPKKSKNHAENGKNIRI